MPSPVLMNSRLKPASSQRPHAQHGPLAAAGPAAPAETVFAHGKFFRLGAGKFHPKGVTYGPFPPGADGVPFPSPERVRRDFELIGRLNANCLRLWHLPPPWLLDLARAHGLKLLVDCNWASHTCFLDDRAALNHARDTVRKTAEALAGHPAVFAITLANEIPPDIARWYGAARIERFIDELAALVKSADPQRLVTFANFPPTEFLQPANIDFVSFNVYLHDSGPFANYLDRLQSIAGDKPLVLTEFGMDAAREGEAAQARILRGHIETAFRAGAAGAFVFAFTDEWHTGGFTIENWFFGLTDRQRAPRPAFQAVAEQYARAPYFALPATPKVSVVVASFNGARTLPACLDSLAHLNYPNYEIILVDDGSTDDTARIAGHYAGSVRVIHQPNLGLSAARNTGIAAASGEIIAFTDSDCRADEDWLYYLVGDLLKTDACAIGGHNFPPPDDGHVAACVAAAPGGPVHVMLDDRTAEHIPGCNMAFWKWALEEIGGFDPQFRAAGDDVDVCWRLLQRGRKIAFSHAGFVWHDRRNTVAAYLKQQRGYGFAEAMLRHKHPEYFNSLGGMRWRGRIYAPSKLAGLFGRFVIYHGRFGGALFQTLYTPEPVGWVTLATSLEWHLLFTFGGLVLAALWPALWPLPVWSLLTSLLVAGLWSARARLPARHRRLWSRPLIASLYLLQPVVRGWPRYAGRLRISPAPPRARGVARALARHYGRIGRTVTLDYWSENGTDRLAFLHQLVERLERDRWTVRPDSGWDEFDMAIYGDRFSQVTVKTVAENHGGNKRLLRAHLRAGWTLLGKIALVAGSGLLLVATRLTWSVLLPLEFVPLSVLWSLPAGLLSLTLLWMLYLRHRARRTLRLGMALLDLTADQLGLTRLSGRDPS
jgi:glycosyltransferase involved in cell wall biosynthesis